MFEFVNLLNEFLKNIPISNQINSVIDEFRHIDWDQINTYEEVKSAIPSALNIFPVIIYVLNEKSEIDFLRLSYPFNEIDKFDANKSCSLLKFSYPAGVYCKNFNRANFPQYPVLYASINSLKGAIDETKLITNRKANIFLGIWKLKPLAEMRLNIFLLKESLSPNASEVLLLFNTILKNGTCNFPKDKKLSLDKLTDFNIKEFTKIANNNSDYKYTAFCCHKILYDIKVADAIAYPSTRNNNITTNIAIHPNFVDNHMYLKEIYHIEVNYLPLLNKENIAFRILNKGIIDNDKISWSDISLECQDEIYNKLLKLF